MHKRIVLAEDEPITRMDIAEMLADSGYDVAGEAQDGFDAVEMCKKYNPDLVILDVKMPLLDGLTAAKIINTDGLANSILLLTAYSSPEFIEKAKEVGVMSYVVKPVSRNALIPAVEIAIHRGIEVYRMKKDHAKVSGRLEARNHIDRAKSVLMGKYGFSEDEAYNHIRKISMDKRKSMKEIASFILMSSKDI